MMMAVVDSKASEPLGEGVVVKSQDCHSTTAEWLLDGGGDWLDGGSGMIDCWLLDGTREYYHRARCIKV